MLLNERESDRVASSDNPVPSFIGDDERVNKKWLLDCSACAFNRVGNAQLSKIVIDNSPREDDLWMRNF